MQAFPLASESISFERKNDYVVKANIELTKIQIGETDVSLLVTHNDFTYNSQTFKIEVLETIPTFWAVEPVDGASYGFELNDAGYYESKNKSKHSSAALCKVTISNPNGLNVYFDCINSGESYCDFGLLSQVGQKLSTSFSSDGNSNSTKVFKNFSGSSSTSIQTVSYGAVEGVIYVKFIKDSSANSGNDTLQFTVRIE